MQHTYHRTSDGAQVSEAEAFDARGTLRPGHKMITPVLLQDGAMSPITDEERFAAMDRRDHALSNAWRNPAPVVDARGVELAKMPDPYERRDARLRDAWKS